ncbi:hypothetical protein K3495_g12120 [Podosphaera aphanis]|nr:hypothetical protein K3495_g12120 [Podosphaera aphanis]
MNTSQTSPATPPRKHLSKDQRMAVKALHNAGRTQASIAQQLNITRRQVGIAVNSLSSSPRHSGRQSTLSEQQVDQIESYIRASPLTRQMSYKELAEGPFAEWNISPYVISRALVKRDYSRCVALA